MMPFRRKSHAADDESGHHEERPARGQRQLALYSFLVVLGAGWPFGEWRGLVLFGLLWFLVFSFVAALPSKYRW